MGTDRVTSRRPVAFAPGAARKSDAPGSAALSLWGLDWSKLLPLRLTDDGIELHVSRVEDAWPFVAGRYRDIFEQEIETDRFYAEPFDGAKLRHLQAADVFEVRHSGETVGVIMGEPSDWSTYYLRSIGLLRTYQGRNLPWRIFPFLFRELAQVGVRRVDAETSPANLATVLILTRMHFNVTGHALSERWGALLRFTKFLDTEAEDVFLGKFCSGIQYQRRARTRSTSATAQERRKP